MYTSIMEITKLKIKQFFIDYHIMIVLIIFFTIMLVFSTKEAKAPMKPPTETKYQDQVDELNKSLYEAEKKYSLDEDPNIIHWEIIDGKLLTYTKQDSIRDERLRWEYVDSLYKESTKELFDN